MSFLPKDQLEPGGGKKGPSMARITLWLVAGGAGIYLLGSGIYELLTK
ncbi:MAG: hypothetical protein ABIX44_06125 [Cryobacterium sp.]